MKNILIVADGQTAKHFIEWVIKKRVAENRYTILSYHQGTLPENMGKHISHIDADPTSYAKMKHIMHDTKYNQVFIIMEEKEDVYYTLTNLQMIDKKIRIVLLNQWDDESLGKEIENITILHSHELLGAHLYDQLPNVPVVAQNIGLKKGEIMEIRVPFGSTYAFRHVGSILQRKWKIVAIYRDEKQILPTNATMIRPNDMLLVVGKPIVLEGVYKTINKRIGLFPEPFGKNLYLLLDLRYDKESALVFLEEARYLLENLEEKHLIVRVLYPNDFALLHSLKSYESKNITLLVCYEEEALSQLIEYDIQKYDIGLVLNSVDTFDKNSIKETLFNLKKVVYLFGDTLLYDVKDGIILMEEKSKMESISSTAFDISEALNLHLTLADFDPEGEFDGHKTTIEHYETLSHIFNMDITIEQKVVNPIRALDSMHNILQIAPFEEDLKRDNFLHFISTHLENFLLTTKKYPKLLVPFALEQ